MCRKVFILTYFFAFFFHVSYSQLWQKTYGDSSQLGRDGIQTFDEGFLLTSDPAVSGFGMTVKLNAYGDTIWSKQFAGLSLLENKDSTFIVAGNLYMDGCIRKFDSLGNIIWIKTYGKPLSQEGISCIIPTFDSGYAACGINAENGTGNAWLLKLDKNGDTLWSFIIGANNVAFAAQVVQTSDSGFVISGAWGWSSSFIAKTNSSGKLLWKKIYSQYGPAQTINQTYDEGLLYYSLFYGLVKLNANGDILWTKRLHPDTRFLSIEETHDKGFICTGFQKDSITNEDILLVKTDSFGNILWNKTFMNGPYYDYASSVCILKDRGYLLCGGRDFTSLNSLMYAIRTDSLGSVDSILQTSVNMTTILNELQVYPNPHINKFHVVLPDKMNEARYQLSNMQGQVLLSGKISKPDALELDTYMLPKGYYILRVTGKDNTILKKIVKEY